MSRRRCAHKFRTVWAAERSRRTIHCNERAAFLFGNDVALCTKHAADRVDSFPDQAAPKEVR
jgi:hypothetical protein